MVRQRVIFLIQQFSVDEYKIILNQKFYIPIWIEQDLRFLMCPGTSLRNLTYCLCRNGQRKPESSDM